MPADLTPDETRLLAVQDAASKFAKACRSVEEHTSRDAATSLDGLINDLMTELWDNGFSTEEIRAAFEAAAKDVGRYAGPSHRNGAGIRGTTAS